MKFARILSLAGFCCISLVASRQSFAQVPESAFKGANIDIVGIAPGMTPQQTFPILEKHLKTRIDAKPSMNTGNFELPNGTRYVGSYFARVSYNARSSNGESIDTIFSSPFSGNRLVFASRTINFADTQRPDLRATVQSVVEKYGKPTLVMGSRLLYMYSGGTLQSSSQTYDNEEMYKGLVDVSSHLTLPNGTSTQDCYNMASRFSNLASKSFLTFFTESRSPKCDGVLSIWIPHLDRTHAAKLEITLVDFTALRTHGTLDAKGMIALDAEKKKKTPTGSTPKL